LCTSSDLKIDSYPHFEGRKEGRKGGRERRGEERRGKEGLYCAADLFGGE